MKEKLCTQFIGAVLPNLSPGPDLMQSLGMEVTEAVVTVLEEAQKVFLTC